MTFSEPPPPRQGPALQSGLLDGLADIVGALHVVSDTADMQRHLTEWRGLYRGEALAVVRPGNTAEVAAVVRFAAANGLAIVPQGGNTGLVGGQIPFDGAREIVLSTERLKRIRDIDPVGNTLVVEAGVTLAEVQAAAEGAQRFFPLSLAAEGSCTIGGNLATNAGGTAVLAYGNARDLVLGLEVVLADGRIWNGLGRLRKDNTGYDLKHLFVGSEGTLGLITAAVVKLFPRPCSREVAFCAVPSPADALLLLKQAQAVAGPAVTAFELMSREALGFVLRHRAEARDPLPKESPWYVLLELSSPSEESLGTTLEAILAAAFEAGHLSDAALAASLDQGAQFWRLREAMSEVQALEGGSIKHDISVPLPALADVVEAASEAVCGLVPGCRPAIFGHVGDGNLHFNVSQPIGADKAAYLSGWEAMNARVHAVVLAHGGSISAEHGIGRLKRDLMEGAKDPVALDLMRGLKTLLDPKGILNPGKVLPAPLATDQPDEETRRQ